MIKCNECEKTPTGERCKLCGSITLGITAEEARENFEKNKKFEEIKRMAWKLFVKISLECKKRALFGTAGIDQRCGISTNREMIECAYEEAEEFYNYANKKREESENVR